MTCSTTHLLVVLAVLISGCQHGVRPNLQSLVGRQVHLEGRFGGPGKLADYVTVPGGHIYLFEPIVSAGQKLEYGSKIAVDGLLGYRSYSPSTQPGRATAPHHYFIERPKVRMLERPGDAT